MDKRDRKKLIKEWKREQEKDDQAAHIYRSTPPSEKVSVDRKTGVINNRQKWQLEFLGTKLNVSGNGINVSISYERIQGGAGIILYNDLELRGINQDDAEMALKVAQDTLEEMGEKVEIQ